MNSKTEVRFRTMVRRWKRELQDATQGLVFFPYVTSSTAETVLCHGKSAHQEVHIVFEPIRFIHGSSSLRTVRKLHDAGCKLFHLPGLHAKVVLIPGKWVSVGSQNLTAGSSFNREASVITTDRNVLQAVNRSIQGWLKDRRPITKEMIDDMERVVGPLRRRYLRIAKEATGLHAGVKDRTWARKAFPEKVAALRLDAGGLPLSQPKFARVRRIETSYDSILGAGSSATRSLMADPDDDLTRWSFGRGRSVLQKTFRYPILHLDTGRLGWARVAKTRITFISSAIDWHRKLRLAGVRCSVGFEAAWDDVSLRRGNVSASISLPAWGETLRVSGWFTPGGLKVTEISAELEREGSPLHRVREYLEFDLDRSRAKLVKRMLEPFKYERKLHGVQADGFFGGIGQWFRLEMANLEERRLLIAKRP